jgi:hypothetical protein
MMFIIVSKNKSGKETFAFEEYDDYQKNRVNFVEDIKKSSKFSKQHAEQLLANLQRYSGNVELREVS